MDKAREKIEAILTTCGVKGAQFVATDVMLALDAAGYRIVGPGEVDAETVEKCATLARTFYDLRHNAHQRTASRNIAAALRSLGENQDRPQPHKESR